MAAAKGANPNAVGDGEDSADANDKGQPMATKPIAEEEEDQGPARVHFLRQSFSDTRPLAIVFDVD